MFEKNFIKWANLKEMAEQEKAKEAAKAKVEPVTEEQALEAQFEPSIASFNCRWKRHNDIRRYAYVEV